MLVLLTDLVDHAIEESLLPALPLITRTHLVIIGGVRDPQVEAWAAGVPPTATAPTPRRPPTARRRRCRRSPSGAAPWPDCGAWG